VAQRIDYSEQAQPTLVRASRNGALRDVRTTGSFWIDPATARVVQVTILWDEGMFLSTLSDVSAPGMLLETTAKYSNVRRIGSAAK
jgi:hypothetical protein